MVITMFKTVMVLTLKLTNMRTITADQFKKQFGDTGVSQFKANTESQSGYLKQIAESVKSNISEASQSLTASTEGRMNPFAAGANIAKNVSGALLTPVSVALKPIFYKTVNPITEKIIGTQPAQRLIDVMSKNPELVGAIADTLETGLNVAGIQGTISTLRSGLNFAKGKVKGAIEPEIPPDGAPPSTLEVSANKTSAGIMNRVARLKPTDEVNFSKLSGKTPGEYLQETGNFGAPDKIIRTESAKFLESKNMVDVEMAKLPGVYRNGAVLDALNGLLERALAVSSENVPASYLSQVRGWLTKYKSTGLTMEEITAVKRLYERNVKLGYNKLLNAEKVEQATNIDNSLRNWRIKQAEELGFDNVAKLDKQTQISKFLIDKLGDQLVGQGPLNAVSLTDWIILADGNIESIGGFLTKKFFSSKAVQAKIAEILNSKEIQGLIEAEVNPTIQRSLRETFPQGVLPELPAPKAGSPQAQINVPIIRTGASSIESQAPAGTKATVNPKTGDTYIRDIKTGKVIRIIPKKK